MSSKLSRAYQIYRQEGMNKLIGKSAQYTQRKLERYWRNVTGRRAITVSDTTAKFEINSISHNKVNNIYNQERQILEQFVSAIEQDDVVYDVGSYFGLYAIFAAKKAEDGHCVAFEPNPSNISHIERNMKLNDLINIQLLEVALSDTSGESNLDISDRTGDATASIVPESNRSSQTSDVVTATGDRLVSENKIPAPNIVKIDVEGAESLVIDGMNNILGADSCRHLFCEVHPQSPNATHTYSISDFGSSIVEIIKQIEQLGFQIESKSRGEQIHLICKK